MIKCCLTAWYNVSDRGQGEVILLAQVDFGIGQGCRRLEERAREVAVGVRSWGRLLGGGLVDILAMCKEKE